MSSTQETTSRKKRAGDNVKRTSEDDHRRKRRNRTTQSCLNCHTSKRMCDRKRPCGRCTQLGLTGLCVYEVDDPNQRSDGSDEKSRLQKRVAELESVIRELKNKPHPRWVQALEAQKSSANARVKSGGSSPSTRSASEDAPSPSESGLQLLPPTAPPSSRASPIDTSMSGPSSSASSSYSSPSPLDTPSPSSLTLSPVEIAGDSGYDLASLLSTCYPDGAGLEGALDSIFDGFIRTDGLNGLSGADSCLLGHDSSHMDGHCGCLSDSGSYNVVLELSLRLRRAAETLNQFPKHRTPSSCPIHQRISDLDRCATEVLGSVNTSATAMPPYGGVSVPSGSAYTLQSQVPSRSQTLSGTISPQSLHNNSRHQWEYKSPSYPTPPSEDSFMSWEPHRRSTDWSP